MRLWISLGVARHPSALILTERACSVGRFIVEALQLFTHTERFHATRPFPASFHHAPQSSAYDGLLVPVRGFSRPHLCLGKAGRPRRCRSDRQGAHDSLAQRRRQLRAVGWQAARRYRSSARSGAQWMSLTPPTKTKAGTTTTNIGGIISRSASSGGHLLRATRLDRSRAVKPS